jgi:glycosyltransferase involved in cell wall biosynthesis
VSKRILFVIDGLAGGGAEKTLLRLARHMTSRGHAVEIATLRDEQALPVPDGVELIGAYDTRSRRTRKFGEVARRARILDTHLAGRPPWDLVLSTLLQTDRIVARSCLADAAWYRVPIHPSAAYVGSSRGMKKRRRLGRLRQTYTGRKVVGISEGVIRDLVEYLGIRPSRYEVIHNPFDIDRIRRLASEPCEREGREYLVHVGRFNEQKRHDRLLDAFSRSSFDGRLVIVGTGTGEQRGRLRELIAARGLEARVDLPGFQVNPYPIIRHARALVLSSDYEGFGNVIVESLVCGTPVVSTWCPSGPDEILTGALAVGLADLDRRPGRGQPGGGHRSGTGGPASDPGRERAAVCDRDRRRAVPRPGRLRALRGLSDPD